MAGRIPQPFIDDLVSRVDIVEVIDSRVPLKKHGREYTACCPFHDEKTPSFTVSPTKQFYHCFGCGAHGTALGFLMEYEHMDFVEAVQELAGRVGMEVPSTRDESGSVPASSSKPLYELLDTANRFFQTQLRKHPQAQMAIDYLKQRGLSGEIARDFGIGFAPPGWNNLMIAMGQGATADMVTAGLVIEAEGKRYDRFRERIMFPIRDRRGRVIGFGGRVLGDEKPKYLNSPETPVFHKGRELYGLYEARQALRELPRLLVVEGYMDVVALAQFGIRYAVATLGTAVTPDHLELLFRASPEVVFCFDGDRAGREAAWRGLENALPLMRDGRQVRFMFLPDGEDPDTLVRRIGKEEFETLIANATPISDYIVSQLRKQVDLGSLESRARLTELARPILGKMPDGIYRQMLSEQLASQVRMDAGELQQRLGIASPAPAHAASRALQKRQQDNRQAPSTLRHAISQLLHYPELAKVAGEPSRFSGLPIPGITLLIEMLELLQGNPHLTTGGILEHWREQPEGRHLFALSQKDPLLNTESDAIEEEFQATLLVLARQRQLWRREQLLQKPFHELSSSEKLELQQLFRDAGQPPTGTPGDAPKC